MSTPLNTVIESGKTSSENRSCLCPVFMISFWSSQKFKQAGFCRSLFYNAAFNDVRMVWICHEMLGFNREQSS